MLQQKRYEHGGVVGVHLNGCIRLAKSRKISPRISPTIAAVVRRFDQGAGMGNSINAVRQTGPFKGGQSPIAS